MEETYDDESGSEGGSTPVMDEHSDAEEQGQAEQGEYNQQSDAEENSEVEASDAEVNAGDLEEGEYVSEGEGGRSDNEEVASDGEVESEDDGGEQHSYDGNAEEQQESDQEAVEAEEGEEGYQEGGEEGEARESDGEEVETGRIDDEEEEVGVEEGEAEDGEVDYQEASDNEEEGEQVEVEEDQDGVEEEQDEGRHSDGAYEAGSGDEQRGSDHEDWEQGEQSEAEAETREVGEEEYEPHEDYSPVGSPGRSPGGSPGVSPGGSPVGSPRGSEDGVVDEDVGMEHQEFNDEDDAERDHVENNAEPQEYEEDERGSPEAQNEEWQEGYQEAATSQEHEADAPHGEQEYEEEGERYEAQQDEEEVDTRRQTTYEDNDDMMGPESPDPERQQTSDVDEPYEPYVEDEDNVPLYDNEAPEQDAAEAVDFVEAEDAAEGGVEVGVADEGVADGGDEDAEIEQPHSPAEAPNDTLDSGDESNEEEAGVGELIADIFGSSDEEDDEEFEGFGEAELGQPVKKKRAAVLSSDDDDDDDDGVEDTIEQEGVPDEEEEEEGQGEGEDATPADDAAAQDSDSDEGVVDGDDGKSKGSFVSDFDLMMEKKKAENRAHRKRRRGGDIINDNDDIIVAMIKQMMEAAKEDRQLNQRRKAATKKLTMLPSVKSQLRKQDLQIAFLDCGVLKVMKEWLMPLPDHSLPNLHIRETLLKILREFPPIDQHMLKTSGIGKAVMCLFRHPKELRHCRDLAGRLINDWSRPIFGVEANFHSMTKEERQERDLAQLSAVKKRRLSSTEGTTVTPKSIDTALTGEERALRPGDKGWVGRARVPLPSTKDYVVRPKWNVEREFSKSGKKEPTKLDKHLKRFKDAKARSKNKNPRAISISIEGRKVAL